MKKIMKRITALLTCAAMLSSAAVLQANAWGLRKTGFDPQDACDDKGMLGFTGDYFVACGGNRNDVPGTEYDYDYDNTYNIDVYKPRRDCISFVLRPGLNTEEAEASARKIVQKYYPDAATKKLVRSDGCSERCTRTMHLFDLTENAGSAELADSLMRDLAAEGLICEYYTWGENARRFYGKLGFTRFDGQYACKYTLEDDDDLDAVEQFLTEHDLNCTIKAYPRENAIGSFYVILNGKRTFRELFDVAAALYEAFGYMMWFIQPQDMWDPYEYFQNSLALLGDVNLDCSVDVSDAVLTARYIAEDSEAALTECGLGNADTNEDGTVTLDDVTLLLQYLAKKIS